MPTLHKDYSEAYYNSMIAKPTWHCSGSSFLHSLKAWLHKYTKLSWDQCRGLRGLTLFSHHILLLALKACSQPSPHCGEGWEHTKPKRAFIFLFISCGGVQGERAFVGMSGAVQCQPWPCLQQAMSNEVDQWRCTKREQVCTKTFPEHYPKLLTFLACGLP